jgi:thiamine-phosphate pyrophosphorylase
MFQFPQPLYPIVDSPAGAEAVLGAGCRLVQLRLKGVPTRDLVACARAVVAAVERAGAQLVINDRADVVLLVGAAGVHLGQTDLPAEAARELLGPGRIIGVSTHNAAQLAAAEHAGVADYLAFGPVFATASKADPDPVQGLAGLRAVRALTARPLVAIGGIEAATLGDVLAAGADAVAVIGAITRAPDPAAAARDLLARATTALRSRLRS